MLPVPLSRRSEQCVRGLVGLFVCHGPDCSKQSESPPVRYPKSGLFERADLYIAYKCLVLEIYVTDTPFKGRNPILGIEAQGMIKVP